ncbi:MAG: hypothetical protein LH609_15080, partial [Rudanella sp.]|nr:hypothetical protein [Rudanella sp.]
MKTLLTTAFLLITFLTNAQNQPDRRTAIHVLVVGTSHSYGQKPIEDFKAAIYDAIKKMDAADLEKKQKEAAAEKAKSQAVAAKSNAPATVQNIVTDEDPKTIFLICDKRDKDNIKELSSYLSKTLHFSVDKMVFDGTDEELKTAYDMSLRDCDAVLIYYG